MVSHLIVDVSSGGQPVGGGEEHGLGEGVAGADGGGEGARERDDELARLLHGSRHRHAATRGGSTGQGRGAGHRYMRRIDGVSGGQTHGEQSQTVQQTGCHDSRISISVMKEHSSGILDKLLNIFR